MRKREYNIKMNLKENGWKIFGFYLSGHLGLCEYSNELYGSIKSRDFFDWLNVMSAF